MSDQIQNNQQSEFCYHCQKSLEDTEKVLFVEEEIGRTFCSEECITQYFLPDVKILEEEYHRVLPENDLTPDEKEKHLDLRWKTLESPEEIWRQKSISGDYRYYLISSYSKGSETLYCVCIALLLQGEPSFLFLAFITRSEEMIEHYRRGEQVQWSPSRESQEVTVKENEQQNQLDQYTDVQADEWGAAETLLANVNAHRKQEDISKAEFPEYEEMLEKALQDPDEIWAQSVGEKDQRLFSLIKKLADQKVWYVIFAKEVNEEEGHLEVLDAFPTRDEAFLESCRIGVQEKSLIRDEEDEMDPSGFFAKRASAQRTFH